jgi:hypothetical protein
LPELRAEGAASSAVNVLATDAIPQKTKNATV